MTAEDFVALTNRVAELERLVRQTPEVRAADERLRGEAIAQAAAARALVGQPKRPAPRLVRVVVSAAYGRDLITPSEPAFRDPVDPRKVLVEATVGHCVAFTGRGVDDISRADVANMATYLRAAEWSEWLASDAGLRAHLAAGVVSAVPCTPDENKRHDELWGEAQRMTTVSRASASA